MKSFALLFLASTSAFAGGVQPNLTINIEEVPTPPEVVQMLDSVQPAPSKPIGDVDIDLIFNLAKEVWQIVKENQPVVDVKYDYANALPHGVQSGLDLAGFSDLQHKSYHYTATNLFGATVVDLTYTLVHSYGGSYHGQGHYVETATVIPSHITVSWGYTVNLAVTKTSVRNVGTEIDPIAALVMDMTFQVSTVVKKEEYRTLYQFRGDSPDVTVI
jgi:hypothetical protein